MFATLDINNRKRSSQLIIRYARKLVKVTYLMRHACIQEDIEENLPMDLIMEFFSTGRRVGGNSGAYRLNRKWEQFLNDDAWASRLEGVRVHVV